jgi:hypothetical protein
VQLVVPGAAEQDIVSLMDGSEHLRLNELARVFEEEHPLQKHAHKPRAYYHDGNAYLPTVRDPPGMDEREFLASPRTDYSPQPKEAQPPSHALIISN